MCDLSNLAHEVSSRQRYLHQHSVTEADQLIARAVVVNVALKASGWLVEYAEASLSVWGERVWHALDFGTCAHWLDWHACAAVCGSPPDLAAAWPGEPVPECRGVAWLASAIGVSGYPVLGPQDFPPLFEL